MAPLAGDLQRSVGVRYDHDKLFDWDYFGEDAYYRHINRHLSSQITYYWDDVDDNDTPGDPSDDEYRWEAGARPVISVITAAFNEQPRALRHTPKLPHLSRAWHLSLTTRTLGRQIALIRREKGTLFFLLFFLGEGGFLAGPLLVPCRVSPISAISAAHPALPSSTRFLRRLQSLVFLQVRLVVQLS